MQQEGKPQQVLAKFLNLMLNYQYGLSVVVEQEPSKAAEQLLSGGVRCALVIQNQEVKNPTTITALSKRGEIPLFMIVPEARLDAQRLICAGMDKYVLLRLAKGFQSVGRVPAAHSQRRSGRKRHRRSVPGHRKDFLPSSHT